MNLSLSSMKVLLLEKKKLISHSLSNFKVAFFIKILINFLIITALLLVINKLKLLTSGFLDQGFIFVYILSVFSYYWVFTLNFLVETLSIFNWYCLVVAFVRVFIIKFIIRPLIHNLIKHMSFFLKNFHIFPHLALIWFSSLKNNPKASALPFEDDALNPSERPRYTPFFPTSTFKFSSNTTNYNQSPNFSEHLKPFCSFHKNYEERDDLFTKYYTNKQTHVVEHFTNTLNPFSKVKIFSPNFSTTNDNLRLNYFNKNSYEYANARDWDMIQYPYNWVNKVSLNYHHILNSRGNQDLTYDLNNRSFLYETHFNDVRYFTYRLNESHPGFLSLNLINVKPSSSPNEEIIRKLKFRNSILDPTQIHLDNYANIINKAIVTGRVIQTNFIIALPKPTNAYNLWNYNSYSGLWIKIPNALMWAIGLDYASCDEDFQAIRNSFTFEQKKLQAQYDCIDTCHPFIWSNNKLNSLKSEYEDMKEQEKER